MVMHEVSLQREHPILLPCELQLGEFVLIYQLYKSKLSVEPMTVISQIADNR